MKVQNLTNSNGEAIRNQFIITGENETVFQSYNSVVCKIGNSNGAQCGAITFGRDWDYSQTTRKHLYGFLSDYGLHVKGADVEKAIKQGYFDQRPEMKVVYDPAMK